MAKELEGAREQADADTKMVLRQVEKDSDELVALLKKERERQQSCSKKRTYSTAVGRLNINRWLPLWTGLSAY